jgi:hypothetical protein
MLLSAVPAACPAYAQQVPGPQPTQGVQVVLSQVGFHPAGLKDVVFRAVRPVSGTFRVVGQSGRIVLSGRMRQGRRDAFGRYDCRADLGALRKEGSYRLIATVNGATLPAQPIRVARSVYRDVLGLARRWWYVQRCGMAIPGWHGLCHADDGAIRDFSQAAFGRVLRDIDATGGWHDAGDLSKWSHYGGYGIWALSATQEALQPAWYGYGTDLPDLLDEARWEALYLLRIQKPDGSFYTGPVTWRPAKSDKGVWSNGNWNYWGPPDKETDNRRGTGDERVVNLAEGSNSKRLMLRNGMALAVFAEALTHHAAGESGARRSQHLSLAQRCFSAARKVYAYALTRRFAEGPQIDFSATALELDLLLDREARQHALPRQGATAAGVVAGAKRPSVWRGNAAEHVREILALQDPKVGWFRSNRQATGPYSDYFHSPGHFVAALIHYAMEYPTAPEVPVIRSAVRRYLAFEARVAAGYPFGQLRQYTDVPNPLELPPMPQGSTPYLCGSAYVEALAGRWLKEPSWVRLAEQQIQWTLGRNPLAISLVVGAGSRFPQRYHTRYVTLPGHADGAIPGGVMNGINGGDGKEAPLNTPMLEVGTKGVSAAWQTNEYWTVDQGWLMLGVLELERALSAERRQTAG